MGRSEEAEREEGLCRGDPYITTYLVAGAAEKVGNFAYQACATLQIEDSRTCAKAGAKFIIADVPSFKAVDDFESSIPAALAPVFRKNCDALVESEAVFAPSRGKAPLFVAHGQHHISETSHGLLAAALAAELRAQ